MRPHPGEAYNVTHDWIDLGRREVHVRSRAATETLPPLTVKADGQSQGNKARIVPVPSPAIPDITAALAASFKAGGFVVLAPKRYETVSGYWTACRAERGWGGHEWRPWQNRDMINNLLRDTKRHITAAGMTLSAPFPLHTFRKSFAQNHADAGTPPRTLAELLGHSDTSVTMEFYNRVTDANRRAAASTVDRLLCGQTHIEGVRDAM